ncbi:MAG TPA: lipopolysaccharide transport periplasmic protein LptA [Steroidobacteraceae bacterium]|nr:lipopolysaccharide transport periplasmic protein LptA [Steroidobacteraceae bacterium]
MAASIRKLCLGLALTWASHAVAAPLKASQEPIDVTAQYEEIDGKNKSIFLRKVRIAQGNMTLTADQGQVNGTGVENAFDNSVWVFKGAVKVTMDQGVLISDEARVTFSNKVLSNAVVTGKPASFQQKIAKTDKVAHGHADSIEYDVTKGIIRLTKDAFLDNGQFEVHGESLKYDVARQVSSAEASEQGSQRVHIIITPPPKSPAKPAPPANPNP